MINRKYFAVSVLFLLVSSIYGGVNFYVSPQGNDAAIGSRSKPFASLERARSAVRTLKKHGSLPVGGVTIWIEPGSYYLTQPLTLSQEDSGSAGSPITYRARIAGQVRFVGGRRVAGFRPVVDPKTLKRLVPSVRGKVVYADLRSAGSSDFGQVAQRGNRLELFFQGQPMHLARWPNSGFVRIAEVAGNVPRISHGIKGTRDGKFVYTGDRPQRWLAEPDIWLHGYWFWDWSDSYEQVDSIDTAKHVISLKPPFHNYGYRKGQRYYALNLLAELDEPGEWYLDRTNERLYFLPPESNGKISVILSSIKHLFVLQDCSWVTIEGMLLEATRSTVITVSGGNNNTIKDCLIRNGGGWAVTIYGGSKHRVTGCDIVNMAEGGISLNGGNRKTLTPGGHRAENNHIYKFGRIYRTYRPAVGVGGVGNYVGHNLIHDGPHNAILLSGNDHIIEYNDISRVCYETGDVGAFYMGRDWTARGTIIRYNYFHDIQGPGMYGAMAVYLDDAASGISIIGNVFYRAAQAAFIGGGRDNLVQNNIFIECASSIHVDARGVGWMKSTVQSGGTLPKRLKSIPYRQPPWSTKYPALVNILDDEPGLPKGNIVRCNISVGSKWLDVEKKALPLIKFENNMVDIDPHFVNRKKLDFRLRSDSPAFKRGFKAIPFKEIGVYPGTKRPADKISDMN